MTVEDSLIVIVQRYAQILDKLEATDSPGEVAALAALTTRDDLQVALNRATSVDDLTRLQIFRLDQRLRQQGEAIARSIPLANWRQSFNPPETAWWWNFPQPVDPRDRLDWLWNALTLVAMTANLSLVVDISSKFLKGGLDFWGSFTVISQSVLTLLTGGSVLTTAGRQAVDSLLQRFGVRQYRWNEAKLGLAAGLLLLLAGLHSSLPAIAQLYANSGQSEQQQGNLTTAQNKLERALSLNPDDAQPHYYLGQIYESVQDPEQAEAEFQRAAKGGVDQAFISLARLYNRTDQPQQAIDTLRELQSERAKAQTDSSPSGQSNNESQTSTAAPEDAELSYGYYTNLGWAYLKQGMWKMAQAELQSAIRVAPQEAAAHCLLAQALERQNLDAIAQWQSCEALADLTNPEEATWQSQAAQRLRSSGQPVPPNLIPLPSTP